MRYEECREYKTAKSWIEDVQPLTGEAADFALDYAKARYQRTLDSFKALDEKADAILRLTGGASAAFTVAASVSGPKADLLLGIPLVPLLVAGILAVVARWPRQMADASRICDLVDDIHDHGLEGIKGRLPAAYHCAVVGMHHVNDQKANLVVAASISLCVTIVALGGVLAYRAFA